MLNEIGGQSLDYPQLMTVDDAVDHIECLIETYDQPQYGHAYYMKGDLQVGTCGCGA